MMIPVFDIAGQPVINLGQGQYSKTISQEELSWFIDRTGEAAFDEETFCFIISFT